ncbi:hypothetical protein EGS38_11480 [Neisseria chenwenguii]|nr:hypothetical protein EGS38_11480 [Neisseria chenwenguii]
MMVMETIALQFRPQAVGQRQTEKIRLQSVIMPLLAHLPMRSLLPSVRKLMPVETSRLLWVEMRRRQATPPLPSAVTIWIRWQVQIRFYGMRLQLKRKAIILITRLLQSSIKI